MRKFRDEKLHSVNFFRGYPKDANQIHLSTACYSNWKKGYIENKLNSTFNCLPMKSETCSRIEYRREMDLL